MAASPLVDEAKFTRNLEKIPLHPLDPAVIPGAPYEPNLPRIIRTCLGAGLLVFFGVAIGLSFLDDRIKSAWDVESFIGKLPADVMILIDEAYHHFVSTTSSYRSFLDYPLDDPRVIVARTFSKIYGLAGLRIGYSVSSREVASHLSALRLPDGVTIVSVKAAIAALEDTAYLQMAAKRNANDRQEFMNQVNARMLRAIDSHANFVLLNPLRPVSDVLLHLEKYDVHVAPPIPAMERYIRVSLGAPSEMREFWRVWDLMPAGNMAM